jgi:hypothetical protein
LSACKLHEKPHADVCHTDAQCPSDRRQHQTFGEQLANDPSSSRAECDAYRKLALARRRAGEQQARQVHRRDEQHETHGTEQHEETRADFPTIDWSGVAGAAAAFLSSDTAPPVRAMALGSAVACAGVTPGFMRATTLRT